MEWFNDFLKNTEGSSVSLHFNKDLQQYVIDVNVMFDSESYGGDTVEMAVDNAKKYLTLTKGEIQ